MGKLQLLRKSRVVYFICCLIALLTIFTLAGKHVAFAQPTDNSADIPTQVINQANTDCYNVQSLGYAFVFETWLSAPGAPSPSTTAQEITTIPGGAYTDVQFNTAQYACNTNYPNLGPNQGQNVYYDLDNTIAATNYKITKVSASSGSLVNNLVGDQQMIYMNDQWPYNPDYLQDTWSIGYSDGTLFPPNQVNNTISVNVTAEAINQFINSTLQNCVDNSSESSYCQQYQFQCIDAGASQISQEEFGWRTGLTNFTPNIVSPYHPPTANELLAEECGPHGYNFSISVTEKISGNVSQYYPNQTGTSNLSTIPVTIDDDTNGAYSNSVYTNANGNFTSLPIPAGDSYDVNLGATGFPNDYYIDPVGGGNPYANCYANPSSPPYCSTQHNYSSSATNNRRTITGYNFVFPTGEILGQVINQTAGGLAPSNYATITLTNTGQSTANNQYAFNDTFNSASPLIVNQNYTMQITNTSFVDGAGNNWTYAGVSWCGTPGCTVGYQGTNWTTSSSPSVFVDINDDPVYVYWYFTNTPPVLANNEITGTNETEGDVNLPGSFMPTVDVQEMTGSPLVFTGTQYVKNGNPWKITGLAANHVYNITVPTTNYAAYGSPYFTYRLIGISWCNTSGCASTVGYGGANWTTGSSENMFMANSNPAPPIIVRLVWQTSYITGADETANNVNLPGDFNPQLTAVEVSGQLAGPWNSSGNPYTFGSTDPSENGLLPNQTYQIQAPSTYSYGGYTYNLLGFSWCNSPGCVGTVGYGGANWTASTFVDVFIDLTGDPVNVRAVWSISPVITGWKVDPSGNKLSSSFGALISLPAIGDSSTANYFTFTAGLTDGSVVNVTAASSYTYGGATWNVVGSNWCNTVNCTITTVGSAGPNWHSTSSTNVTITAAGYPVEIYWVYQPIPQCSINVVGYTGSGNNIIVGTGRQFTMNLMESPILTAPNPADTFNVTITGPSNGVMTPGGGAYPMSSVTYGGGTVTYSATETADFPGTYNVTFELAGSDVPSTTPNPCNSGSTPTPIPIIVANQPYLNVTGGDTIVGSGFATSTEPNPTCTQSLASNANIYTWNSNDTFSPTNFALGAGVQFAAQALGTISGFASQYPPAVTTVGTNLSFANSAGLVTSDGQSMGGQFGTAPCAYDYYGNLPTNATTVSTSPINVSSLTSSASPYIYTGTFPLTLNGTLGTSQKVTLYVPGTVYINNSGGGNGVVFSQPANATPSTLTSFNLIVNGGDINIDPSVTTLDGVYVTQTGTIATCANSVGQRQPANTCNSQLTVEGALVANTLKLWRTYGTMGTTAKIPNSPAEVVKYSPYVWLAEPTTASSNTFNAISNLPPVL